jgi:hypothetical protein
MSLRALLNDQPQDPDSFLSTFLNQGHQDVDKDLWAVLHEIPQDDDVYQNGYPMDVEMTNVPQTLTAPSDTSENCNKFFPDDTDQHGRLRIAMWGVMRSNWKMRNKPEPSPTDLLQFTAKTVGEDAHVNYSCLMHHEAALCTFVSNRVSRTLHHLRNSIGLRPFPCEGGDDELWYVLHLEPRGY